MWAFGLRRELRGGAVGVRGLKVWPTVEQKGLCLRVLLREWW